MRKLSKAELDKVLRRSRQWGESNGKKGERAELSEVDLRVVDLRKADLSDANLRGADLRGTNLQYADLFGADLRNADLEKVDLRSADLSRAMLHGAKLCNADLRGANLQEASISTNKVPSLLGNILVTKTHYDIFGSMLISTWIEISDDDLELYRELYG